MWAGAGSRHLGEKPWQLVGGDVILQRGCSFRGSPPRTVLQKLGTGRICPRVGVGRALVLAGTQGKGYTPSGEWSVSQVDTGLCMSLMLSDMAPAAPAETQKGHLHFSNYHLDRILAPAWSWLPFKLFN